MKNGETQFLEDEVLAEWTRLDYGNLEWIDSHERTMAFEFFKDGYLNGAASYESDVSEYKARLAAQAKKAVETYRKSNTRILFGLLIMLVLQIAIWCLS